MSEGIRPALTPEEWAEGSSGLVEIDRDGWLVVRYPNDEDGYSEIILDNAHGAAALCLYGQPFGFTWDDVDTLRHEASYLHEAANRDAKYPVVSEYGADLESLAARLAALLPPRETKPEP